MNIKLLDKPYKIKRIDFLTYRREGAVLFLKDIKSGDDQEYMLLAIGEDYQYSDIKYKPLRSARMKRDAERLWDRMYRDYKASGKDMPGSFDRFIVLDPYEEISLIGHVIVKERELYINCFNRVNTLVTYIKRREHINDEGICLYYEYTNNKSIKFYGIGYGDKGHDMQRVIEYLRYIGESVDSVNSISYSDFVQNRKIYLATKGRYGHIPTKSNDIIESKIKLIIDEYEYDLKDDIEDEQLSAEEQSRREMARYFVEWIEEHPYGEMLDYVRSRVKGQPELDIVVANIYNYIECLAEGIRHSNSMLIAAPSGTGKTETYRAVSKYFKSTSLSTLPIVQIDATSITEEGFKGKDTKAIIEPLKATGEVFHGAGIIFLDEFDKKLIPSYSAKGNDVNKAVQSQLLTTIEGLEYPEHHIDTSNTLFIGLGSFDECRTRKSEVINHIGFGSESEGGAEHYTHITREDMIELGASYELIGRFTNVINYDKLSSKTIDEIIDDTVKEEERRIGVKIELKRKARRELHEWANSKYGCRIFKSLINDLAMRAYSEILKEDYPKGDARIVVESAGKYKVIVDKGQYEEV